MAYATTQTLSDSLNDQNRAVLAALGFVAAVATGGLAVQIIKKVWTSWKRLIYPNLLNWKSNFEYFESFMNSFGAVLIPVELSSMLLCKF